MIKVGVQREGSERLREFHGAAAALRHGRPSEMP